MSGLKHVSTATTLGSAMPQTPLIHNNNIAANNNMDEDATSSNEIQIVQETTNSSSSASKQPSSLTEAALLEHNKSTSSSSSNQTNGGGLSSTNDYIARWAMETRRQLSVIIDEKPFPCEVVPIETFGPKIIDNPQYLLCKSRLGAGNGISTTPPATNAVATAAKPVTQASVSKPAANAILPPKTVNAAQNKDVKPTLTGANPSLPNAANNINHKQAATAISNGNNNNNTTTTNIRPQISSRDDARFLSSRSKKARVLNVLS
jgi:hypothetical protein